MSSLATTLMKLLSDLFDLLVVRFFDFSFANCFLDFILFSPTPNETGFLIKMIRFLICCWAVFYKAIVRVFMKVIVAYSIYCLNKCVVGWCRFNVAYETLVLLHLKLIVWCFFFIQFSFCLFFPGIFCLSFYVHCFFWFSFVFVFFLMKDFVVIDFFQLSSPLNHPTSFWSSTLPLNSVDLFSRSQCLNNFSVSISELWSTTYILISALMFLRRISGFFFCNRSLNISFSLAFRWYFKKTAFRA